MRIRGSAIKFAERTTNFRIGRAVLAGGSQDALLLWRKSALSGGSAQLCLPCNAHQIGYHPDAREVKNPGNAALGNPVGGAEGAAPKLACHGN